jgi:hypothetical protein
MKINQITILIIVCIAPSVGAQEIEYAREIVNILASDSLFGRGYVNDGDKKAAHVIKKEFEQFGVQPFNDSYFQEFYISTNTFPDSIFLSVDGNDLNVGQDFHVLPVSPSIIGDYEIEFIHHKEIFDQETLLKRVANSSGKFIVLDEYPVSLLDQSKKDRLEEIKQFLIYHPSNPAIGTIFLSSDKLTWYGSRFIHSKPSIYLKKEFILPSSKHISVHINNHFIEKYKTQNVIGLIEGEQTDSLIVLTAHYDHFGMMGQSIFPGANDNASGVAMLLSFAKHFNTSKPKYSMMFIAFGAEELGLLGSSYFTEHPIVDLSTIKFLLNFDIAGTGDEGIQVVNGSIHRNEFDHLVHLNEQHRLLPRIKIRGAACNSDHCNFTKLGVPGFYIYTLGGITAYHDVYDRAETLPLTEFEDYFNLMILFIEGLE